MTITYCDINSIRRLSGKHNNSTAFQLTYYYIVHSNTVHNCRMSRVSVCLCMCRLCVCIVCCECVVQCVYMCSITQTLMYMAESDCSDSMDQDSDLATCLYTFTALSKIKQSKNYHYAHTQILPTQLFIYLKALQCHVLFPATFTNSRIVTRIHIQSNQGTPKYAYASRTDFKATNKH